MRRRVEERMLQNKIIEIRHKFSINSFPMDFLVIILNILT